MKLNAQMKFEQAQASLAAYDEGETQSEFGDIVPTGKSGKAKASKPPRTPSTLHADGPADARACGP